MNDISSSGTESRRLSITKQQRQLNNAIELISLCQTFTSDGRLANEEIAALRNWLQDNQSEDLPAIQHLYGVVETVLADGVVTDEERQTVYAAVETILPPDIRQLAKANRREVEKTERETEREAARQAKAAEKAERQRNRRIARFNFMVAGVRYDNRPSLIKKRVRVGDQAKLQRDPNNRYSDNAIEVLTRNGAMIGFVPEEYAEELAPLLDEGNQFVAVFSKVLSEGRSPIPVVNCEVYGAEAEVEDTAEALVKPPPPSLWARIKRGITLLVYGWLIAAATLLIFTCSNMNK